MSRSYVAFRLRYSDTVQHLQFLLVLFIGKAGQLVIDTTQMSTR